MTNACNLIPPHEVTQSDKLVRLVQALKSGEPLTPVVVQPNGVTAICGSHRIAAALETDDDIEVLTISDEDWAAALQELGVDDEDWDAVDWNTLCEAVFKTTIDERVRAALEDQ